MRRFVLAGLCVMANCYGLLFAQNKTLGVGVPSPNLNAALHVESPTGNQGFIMPRLTTVQREAMASLLTASDNGLMLYDTDLNTMFTWDGTAWKSSSTFSVSDTTSTDNVIDVLNRGLGNAGRFRNQNRGSKTPAVWAETNSDSTLSAPIYGLNTGTGDVAASFRLVNSGSNYPALYGETFGRGGVARFINNGTGGSTVFAQVTNTGHGYWSQHEGTNGYAAILQSVNPANPAPAVFVEAVGTGFSLFVQKSQATSTGDGIYSEHLGTAGSAARFVIDNPANASAGFISTTNGSGAAIVGENTGTTDGFAGNFRNTSPTNNFPAIQASTEGNGSGVRVMQPTGSGAGMDVYMQNTASTAPGLSVSHDGLGSPGAFNINNGSNTNSGVRSYTAGLGDAGFFEINNPSSTNTAVKGRVTNTGGGGGAFEVFNASNPYAAVFATTQGTGNASTFEVNNGSSGASAIFASTNGTGNAISANTATGWTALHARREGASNGNAAVVEIADAANSFPALQVNTVGSGFAINAQHSGANGDAIYGEHTGGAGSAGNFRISNNNNTASALYAATTSPGGNAMSVSNDANGIAFTIWNGGMQITTSDVTTGTSLATRASAYRITSLDGTTFTIDFGPRDGEVFMVYNETAQPITVGGVSIPANDGKTLVVFPGGVVRGF